MKVVGISFLILILDSFTIPSCQATIEKEYIEQCEFSHVYECCYFAFRVKAIIQTEKDGTWISDNTYEVSIFVTITQRNDTQITSLVLGEMDIDTAGLVTCTGSHQSYGWNYAGRTRSWSFYVDPPPTQSWSADALTYVNLQPRFQYNYTEKSFPYHDVSREWEADEPLYIYVTDPATDVVSRMNSIENQLSTITNLMYALIVTTVVLIATTGYLAVKKHKAK